MSKSLLKCIGVAAVTSLMLGEVSQAHHVAFCKAVIQAVEKPDLATVRDLFEEAAWHGRDEGVSAAALQERLKRGKLVALRKSSELKFEEYASNDKFDSRLRCVLTFRIAFDGSADQVYLLAKRVRDDGASNPMAWRIWRIVTDQTKAEFFLGQKIKRNPINKGAEQGAPDQSAAAVKAEAK